MKHDPYGLKTCYYCKQQFPRILGFWNRRRACRWCVAPERRTGNPVGRPKKLSADQIAEIKSSRDKTVRELALIYSVGVATIQRVLQSLKSDYEHESEPDQ